MDKDYYHQKRPEIFGLVPAEAKRVLEIGCAAGGFYENFRNGVEYWGVEPVENAAAEASKKFKVLKGDLFSVESSLPNGYFDVIVCNDVIEHIFDSDRAMEVIKRKMAPNGVIVGSIPNVRFIGNLVNLLFKRDWEYTDGGILDNTHVRFFTKKSFRRLMERHGFVIEVLKGVGSVKLAVFKAIFILFILFVGGDLFHMQLAFKARIVK